MSAFHTPRFLRGVAVLATDDGLLIEGLASPLLLGGTLALTILPKLITLLDGRNTLEFIANSYFPAVPLSYIAECISALSNWGLLETADHVDYDEGYDTAFLRRLVTGRSVSTSTGSVINRLRTHSVRIVRSATYPAWAELLSTLLVNSRISDSKPTADLALDNHDKPVLYICLYSNLESQSLDSSYLPLFPGSETLHVSIDESADSAEVGPCTPGSAANYRAGWPLPLPAQLDALRPITPDALGTLASFVARDVLLRVGVPEIGPGKATIIRYAIGTWQSEPIHRLHSQSNAKNTQSLPSNQFEGVRALAKLPSSPIVALFENAVAIDSRAGLSQTAAERFGDVITHRQIDTRRFLNSRRIILPPLAIDLNSTIPEILENFDSGPGRLDLEHLACLLALISGVRDSTNLRTLERWLPSAGNLGSVECCVVVRDVKGLEAGCFEYLQEEPCLVSRQMHDNIGATGLMQSILGRPIDQLPCALIILVGGFHKLNPKYGAFGFKLAYLDAGVAISQMRMLAACMSLSARVAPSWDDHVVEEHFRLRVPGEFCTAVVEVHGEGSHLASMSDFSVAQQHGMTPQEVSAQRPAYSVGTSMQNIIEDLYRNTRRSLEVARPKPPITQITTEIIPLSESVELPRSAGSRMTLGRVLRTRSSVRSFSTGTVPIEFLSALLDAASEKDRGEWNMSNEKGDYLKFLVLLKSSLGGYQVYEQSYHSPPKLQTRRIAREELRQLYVQPDFEAAPLHLAILADVDYACSLHGAYGYTQLLMRAGAAGHRCWMTAVSLGLVGCIVAGVIREAADRLLHDDEKRSNLLLAFCAGFPQNGEPRMEEGET